jgi:rhamnogalacturonan endolyase
MKRKKPSLLNRMIIMLLIPLLCITTPVWAEAKGNTMNGGEKLDRGLVAVSTSEGVYLSWRFLSQEATGYSKTGLTGANFNVYRNGKKIAVVKDSTNFLDRDGNSESTYYVSSSKNEKGTRKSAVITPMNEAYYDLKLKKPKDGRTPDGQTYTYEANDTSVGDVDGDGQYELFVKWDPSNSKDVSQVGYTGNAYIDCYKLDGTFLYRIDLGVNIRAGAHYTQFLVYDFDQDGKAEMMLKTAPGTKTIQFDKRGNVQGEKFITMPKEDIKAGYRHSDDYRMSSEDYYDHVVKMFMNWHKHEEVQKGNWPKTLEECFGIAKKYRYPLSREDAESLADYFMDEYAPKRSERNKLRDFQGFILEGPEYLTVFEGATGKELETINYEPQRYDDGLMWGDYATPRIEPGNRVDRFLSGVAYLERDQPYAIFARGYYTRANLVSYRWDGKELKKYWAVDSGWTSMSNPFNSNPHEKDGNNKKYSTLTNQGAHYLTTSDVDNDGKQEIVYGGATIDHNGKLLYSSYGKMPTENEKSGEGVKLGHGDTLHVADINPKRSGLEIFMVHENGTKAPYGYSLRDAKTGEVIVGEYTGKDTGRGIVGDIDPAHEGLEMWATSLLSADGQKIDQKFPGTNMSIRWGTDMTTQLINGTFAESPTIDDWKRGRLLTATNTSTNNGTKGNPSLVADVFGDWREELIVKKADSSALHIYMSTEKTNHKLYTLMHDKQYRTGIANQNTGYNQPAYPSFYFASDMNWRDVPLLKKHH